MLPDQGDATDDDGGDCDYERVETRDLVVVYMLWLFVGFTRMVLCNGRRMGVLSCRLYLFYSYIQFQFIQANRTIPLTIILVSNKQVNAHLWQPWI